MRVGNERGEPMTQVGVAEIDSDWPARYGILRRR